MAEELLREQEVDDDVVAVQVQLPNNGPQDQGETEEAQVAYKVGGTDNSSHSGRDLQVDLPPRKRTLQAGDEDSLSPKTARIESARTPTFCGRDPLRLQEDATETYGQVSHNNNNNKEASLDMTFCKICSLTLSSSVVALDHYKGKSHAKRIKSLQAAAVASANDKSGDKTFGMGSKEPSPPDDDADNDRHRASNPHKLNVIVNKKEKKSFYCAKCQVKCASQAALEDHIAGPGEEDDVVVKTCDQNDIITFRAFAERDSRRRGAGLRGRCSAPRPARLLLQPLPDHLQQRRHHEKPLEGQAAPEEERPDGARVQQFANNAKVQVTSINQWMIHSIFPFSDVIFARSRRLTRPAWSPMRTGGSTQRSFVPWESPWLDSYNSIRTFYL